MYFLTCRKWQRTISKHQTGWKPLLEWQYHLLDYKVPPQSRAKPPLSVPALLQCQTNTSPYEVQDCYSPTQYWRNGPEHWHFPTSASHLQLALPFFLCHWEFSCWLQIRSHIRHLSHLHLQAGISARATTLMINLCSISTRQGSMGSESA